MKKSMMEMGMEKISDRVEMGIEVGVNLNIGGIGVGFGEFRLGGYYGVGGIVRVEVGVGLLEWGSLIFLWVCLAS